MNRYLKFIMLLTVVCLCGCVQQQVDKHQHNKSAFTVIALGTKGGIIEADVSSYLVAPTEDKAFIALDAGSLYSGLQQAEHRGSLQDIVAPDSELVPEADILRNHIKAYAISHAHIDHVSGLVLNAPNDSKKPILGLPFTIDNIRDHLFNWQVWPNFADEGVGYQLKKYHYQRLVPQQKIQVDKTNMMLTPFELSHSGDYLSTAFLIESDGEYLLYFGDTGPDEIEKSDRMQQIWRAVAPLIREQKLHAIFLECSYPNQRADKLLFGHLTPKWMMKELNTLAQLVDAENPQDALHGLKLVVTHIKPTIKRNENPTQVIEQQLSKINNLGVEFIVPESGQRFEF